MTAEDLLPAPVSEREGTSSADDKVGDRADRTEDDPSKLLDVTHSVGLAVIEQGAVIPRSGARKISTRLEYWMYIVFNIGCQGIGIGNYGQAIQQFLLAQQFPNGIIPWAGGSKPLSSVVLDLNGILFAIQLVVLLFIGPYADYGSWRPWLLIFFTVIYCGMTLGFTALRGGAQWQTANALYVIGNFGLNVGSVFYNAAFPGLVRDLPAVVQSEEAVLQGHRSAEEHATLDMLERSKIYNLVNIVGSGGNLVLLGIATGVAWKIGSATPAETVQGYRVLAGFFGAVTVLTVVPWFLVEQYRPGQQLPKGTRWYLAGPKQVWQALRCCYDLRQCFLYLLAYFLLQDVYGTGLTTVSILQNESVNFSTIDFSAFTLVLYGTGGLGTLFVMWIQMKWRLSVKTMLRWGAIFILILNLWGLIGVWTKKFGYHRRWEFWAFNVYNFTMGCWGSYSVTMITEVCPAPKVYLFMSLFNTVGKTSQFIGPFITAAIVNDVKGNTNYGFYFLFFTGCIGYVLLWFVDPDKAKLDNARYLEREAQELYGVEMGMRQNLEETVVAEV